jgi:hypothetical protein
MQVPSLLFQATLLFFIDVGGDLIMADDATTSSNPSIMQIRNEKFTKTPFDVNVSQQPCKEKPIGRVVHTRMAKSIWNCQVSFNLCALTIYLQLVPSFENWFERFNEC